MMIEPEIGEKVNIGGVIYECAEPQQAGWMWAECDLYADLGTIGCLGCGILSGCVYCDVQCNAYYRKDGKHIILKRITK